jgi:hypothetical protein
MLVNFNIIILKSKQVSKNDKIYLMIWNKFFKKKIIPNKKKKFVIR